jgi:hypothetical protein
MFKDHLIFSNNIYDAAKQILEAQLILEVQKETKKRNTEKVIVTGAETPEGEYLPVLQGYYASGKGAKRGTYVEFDAGDAIPGVPRQTEHHDAVEFAAGEADANNIFATGKPIKVQRRDIATFNNLKEANIRNPTDQFNAGLHRDKPAGWQNRRADQQPTNSYVPRYKAGLDRMYNMINYQAAHAIASPHEREAIEAVLTDMANSGTGTAANMGHMRTAIGAVNRLRGTGAWSKSYWATRDPIERAAMDQAGQRIKRGQEDIEVDSDTLRNTYTDDYAAEQYDDAFGDVAQQQILGSRKKR